MNYEEYVESFRKRSLRDWENELKRLRFENPGKDVHFEIGDRTPRAVFG